MNPQQMTWVLYEPFPWLTLLISPVHDTSIIFVDLRHHRSVEELANLSVMQQHCECLFAYNIGLGLFGCLNTEASEFSTTCSVSVRAGAFLCCKLSPQTHRE